MKRYFFILTFLLIFTAGLFCAENNEVTFSTMPKPNDGFVGVHITPILGFGVLINGEPEKYYSGGTDDAKFSLEYLLKISYGFDEDRILKIVLFTGYIHNFYKSEWTGNGYLKASTFLIATGFQFGFIKEPKIGFYPYAGMFIGGAFGKNKASFPDYEESNSNLLFILHSGFKYFFHKNVGIEVSISLLFFIKYNWVNDASRVLIFTPSLGIVTRF